MMEEYIKRICDNELELKLEAFGAVHIVDRNGVERQLQQSSLQKAILKCRIPTNGICIWKPLR